MGDSAENALQPSKKRAAGREISRDNPGLDDDDEDSPEQELGTFKKASDEVLATRRIVKVRRGPPLPSSSAPPPASSNPFAGIKLVPQTLAKPNPNPDLEPEPELGHESEKGNQEEDKTKHPEPEEPPKPVAEEEQVVTEKKAQEQEEEEVVTEKKGQEEEDIATTTTSHSLNSFQQLSSSQNAFTNLSGTGFSTSTFSFGPIKSDGPGSGFGFSNNGAGGSSSLFMNSSSSSSMAAKIEAGPPPSAMKEVEVETGEENEEAVFSSDSVLYEFTGSLWKERGKGEVKINVSKKTKKRIPEEAGEGQKARLVMRAKGNYRLILNASLFPDMKLTAMDKKGLSFACVNCTGDEEEESSKDKAKFSTFALKFKDPLIVEEFRRAFAAHKGKSPAAAAAEIATVGLKTPENSPKASSD